MSGPRQPGVAPGPHGGDVVNIARALGRDLNGMLDLSASLNPVAPDVADLAAAHLGALRRYPDTTEAEAALARAIGVDLDRVLLTSGGAEAIALVAHELGGTVDEPEFALHPRGARDGLRWRSNPHNPSGRLAAADDAADVWDEAFYPLATGEWTRGDASASAVVGSLTKVFACPGLRLGYVLADPELVAGLRARQTHWSVGGLGASLLPDLLALADLPGWARQIADLRCRLVGLLRGHGLEPEPSDANYLLCPVPPGFRAKLLGQGIIVRDCASFGLPDLVRIAVPDPGGLERLAGALAEEGGI